MGDGNSSIDCPVTELSREQNPVFLDGYRRGDKVFYQGPAENFPNGDRVLPGLIGTVVGKSTEYPDKSLAVEYEGNSSTVDCFVTTLNREQNPVFHGGYRRGDKVFYQG